MKIITISREFGSGGRELGKRISDILGYDYYDREIISAIAEKSGFDENYIKEMTEKKLRVNIPISYGRTMYYEPYINTNAEKILAAQSSTIRDIAEQGRDCVIIGRGADVILSRYNTVNIFVYADMEYRVKRCLEYSENEKDMTEKKIIKKIKEIDSARASFHSFLSEGKWGRKENYNLCINTTGLQIKNLAPIIAEYAEIMFKQKRSK